jgi:hypothetical protein
MCDLETIGDWQQRGVTARILGYPLTGNPLLKECPARAGKALDDWRQKIDAWSFGWEIEDAARGQI